MHQYSKNMLPPCFLTFFSSLSKIHDRQFRSKSKNNVYLPKFSTCRCQRSLRFQGVKIWNSLNPDLKKQPYQNFKISIKNHLLESYAHCTGIKRRISKKFFFLFYLIYSKHYVWRFMSVALNMATDSFSGWLLDLKTFIGHFALPLEMRYLFFHMFVKVYFVLRVCFSYFSASRK